MGPDLAIWNADGGCFAILHVKQVFRGRAETVSRIGNKITRVDSQDTVQPTLTGPGPTTHLETTDLAPTV